MRSLGIVLSYLAAGVLLVALVLVAVIAAARYRRRPKFRTGTLEPLEKRLLAILVERSDPAVSERLRRQLELLTVHCRLHHEKSMRLELYPAKPDWPRLDEGTSFPNQGEFRIATLSFEASGRAFKVQFDAVNGRLFGLVVRPNPKPVLGASEIAVARFRKGANPLEPAEPPGRVRTELYDTLPEATGLLAEWIGRFDVGDVHRPLDAATAERHRSRIGATLPADYLELMKDTNGLDVGGWRILGLTEVHSLSLGEHNYYALADNTDFVLSVRENSKQGSLYRCDISDDEPRPAGGSFREVIEGWLARRVREG